MEGNGQSLYFDLGAVDGVSVVELTPNREIPRREIARLAAFAVPCPDGASSLEQGMRLGT